MSFAGALNVLRPTLPYYLALTRDGLPRLKPDGFEPHPSLAAPPLALEVARAMFALGGRAAGTAASGHPCRPGQRSSVPGSARRHPDDLPSPWLSGPRRFQLRRNPFTVRRFWNGSSRKPENGGETSEYPWVVACLNPMLSHPGTQSFNSLGFRISLLTFRVRPGCDVKQRLGRHLLFGAVGEVAETFLGQRAVPLPGHGMGILKESVEHSGTSG
jgi:hypothetical protein